MIYFFFVTTNAKRSTIDKTKLTTPPNLLGIDRKIAYANRKYHSGWIWIGVLRGFATLKFSGSFRKNGTINDNIIMATIKLIIGKMSFTEK